MTDPPQRAPDSPKPSSPTRHWTHLYIMSSQDARSDRPPVYYHSYLRLNELLATQQMESAARGAPAHDEMLFIIVHQSHELWFKQILHEVDSIIRMFEGDMVDEKSIGVAVSRLERITQIQTLLIETLRTLETMTSLDFLDFRDFLSPASGFQSVQFRLIENKLGLKTEGRVEFDPRRYHSRLSPEHQRLVLLSETEPNLFDLIERWLERTPFLEIGEFEFLAEYRKAVKDMLAGDARIIENHPTLSDDEKAAQLAELEKTRQYFETLFHKDRHDALVEKGQRRLSYKATLAVLLIQLYRDQPILHLPFRFLETLLDIDENFTIWRSRHAIMVHRMIGRKIGTGGSAGHAYLQKTAAAHQIFSDLFDLSTFLIPRSSLPPLPPELERALGFYFTGKDEH